MAAFSIFGGLKKLSPNSVFLLGASLEGVIAIADINTPVIFNFSPLYIFPIAIVAWFGSRHNAFLLAIVAGFAGIYELFSHYGEPIPISAIILSVATESAMFLTFAFVTILLRRHVESLAIESRTDSLTAIANRRHFFQQCDIEISRAARYKFPLTLAYFDVNNFKQVNDHLGHEAGDRLLKIIADVLRAELRSGDLCARLGGDEFVLLLSHMNQDDASLFIGRIRNQVLEAIIPFGNEVGISIGLASCTADTSVNSEALLAMADKAMYAEKSVLRQST